MVWELNPQTHKLHSTKREGYAEKLNSLITVNNPLTADDMYSAALLISLPPDWINCLLSLMNDKNFPSTRIVRALKQECLQRKAHLGNNSNLCLNCQVQILKSVSQTIKILHILQTARSRSPFLQHRIQIKSWIFLEIQGTSEGWSHNIGQARQCGKKNCLSR
ncbi:uncharacterized protein VP01_4450g1 [Puccinia sorghi]|uniref:Uncharacterized protein n=1 Tax=Puccinia sorghi TaxID=27349 RepID=A0A0L6UPD0_9BASI|nr:uncharacterized protein VP01_4450g1 [Puccinia sorghi]